MSSDLLMQGNNIAGLANPTRALHALNYQYVDATNNRQVSKRGDTMSGNLYMGSNLIRGLPTT